MKFPERKIGRFQVGIWIALAALLFALFAWFTQFYSLINWEGALKLGLQNESLQGDAVEVALANVEKGVALADMVWPLPLTILALVGLLYRKFYGWVAAMMTFAICVYFPLFFAFQKWNHYPDTVLAAFFLFALPSITGIISLWATRSSFLNN